MTNIGETIRNASVNTAFQIDLDNMMDCYNNHILYKSKDLPLLEVSLEHNTKYVIQVGDREFCTIRAYCG